MHQTGTQLINARHWINSATIAGRKETVDRTKTTNAKNEM